MNQPENEVMGLSKDASRRGVWLAWVFLLAGLIATALAVRYTKSAVDVAAEKEFDFVCNEIRGKIQDRLSAHEQILRSGAAFFEHSGGVNRQEWRRFTDRQKVEQQLPGIQGIGFALLIPRQKLAQHVQEIRAEGFPAYHVRPEGEREIYSSIIYLEPFTNRNLRAFGYDMLSEPVRRAAMERARDQDTAALSGKVILVQETDKNVQAGTLMYVPVYRTGMPCETVVQRRAAILGWVYSPYRMNDLMQGIMGVWDLATDRRIHLEVFDGEQATAETLLYDSQSAVDQQMESASRLTSQSRCVSAGRQWTLRFTMTGSQASAMDYGKVWLVLFGGTSTSLLLAGLFFNLLNTRFKARQMARQLTTELRQSEEKIHLLLNSTAEAIYGLDMNGTCTFCNNACLRLLRYKHPDELLGKNMHLQIHSKHSDGTLFPVEECRIFQAFKKGEGAHVDDEVLWRSDGTSFLAEYWSYPQRSDGVVVGAVVTFLNITERKRIEEEIKRQRALLSSLLDSIPDIVFFKDTEGVYLGCNPAFAEFVGRTREQIIGRTDYDLFDKDVADFFIEHDRSMMETKEPQHNDEWITYPDGRKILLDTLKTPYWGPAGEMLGVLGISRDITDRKRAEESLRQVTDRLMLAVRAGSVGIWDYDVVNNRLVWDDQMFRLYGITQEHFGGAYEAWLAGVHPEDRQRGDEEIRLALRGEKDFDTEFRVVYPSGSIHNIRALALVQRDASGQPLHMIGTNWDITMQRHIEETLTSHTKDFARINEDLYREKKQTELILHDIGDGVAVVDLAGHIVMLNAVAKDLLGVTATITGASEVNDLFMHCALSERHQQIIHGRIPMETFSITVNLEQPLVLEVNCTTLHDEKKRAAGHVYVFHDVTRMQEIDRMKSNFISSVSHELRTPLTSIRGFAKTILNDPQMSEQTRLNFMTIIDKEAERLASLIEDVLEISRIEAGKATVCREPYTINEIMVKMLPSMQRLADEKRLVLQWNIQDDLPALTGDSGKMQSAFTNLLFNAIKFTPAGGSILFSAFLEESAIVVQVRDTGLGIPEKDLPRIFERFYRVQRPGIQIPGTGLGLAICRDLVNLHGGHISVESTVNKGTLFSVCLPLDFLPGDHKE